jgi:hypothetical protein
MDPMPITCAVAWRMVDIRDELNPIRAELRPHGILVTKGRLRHFRSTMSSPVFVLRWAKPKKNKIKRPVIGSYPTLSEACQHVLELVKYDQADPRVPAPIHHHAPGSDG